MGSRVTLSFKRSSSHVVDPPIWFIITKGLCGGNCSDPQGLINAGMDSSLDWQAEDP